MADSTLSVKIEGSDNLSQELKTVQSNVIRFVGAISSAFAALGGLVLPVLESARFQRELLEAGKTTDYTKDQLESLKTSLVDLSTQINVTAIDLAKIAAMGGQMGVGGNGNVSALAAFTEEVARAVTALDMPAEQAVMALGKLINIFNVPAAKYRNLISSLNEVSNTSNATAEELFDVARRIGNLGGAVSMPEAAALSASMIDLGQTAETAGTTLTKVFADMRSKAGEFAAFIGGTMTEQKWIDMMQGRGLDALNMYLDRLNAIAPAAAAAAKVDLTGGGRIFEAVTKLQAQRERAVLLENEANREAARIDAHRASMSEAELLRAQSRVDSLRDLAKEANIVSRLTGKALDAYESGDSAMKEQQTVLSGLVAQWSVFLNNATKTAMGLGDAVLLPLTELLTNMSAVLQDTDVGGQLGDGMREIIENLRTASEYLSHFVGGLDSLSSGVDWGAALQAGALLSAALLIRLTGTALGALGTSLQNNTPLLRRFSQFLFGTSSAMRDAQEQADALAAKHERIGGVYDRVNQRLTGYVANVQNVVALNARAAQVQGAINQSQQVYAQRLAAVQTEFQGVGQRLRTRQALEASIATAQGRLAAAQVAGNNRAVASNLRVVASQTAVLAAVDAAQARADSAARAIQRMQTSLAATQASAASLTSTGVRMALAFDQARNAGVGLGASITAALGATGATSTMGRAIAALTAQIGAAKAAMASLGVTATQAFVQGQNSATGLRGVLAGVTNAVNVLSTAMHVKLSTAASSGLTRLIAGFDVLRARITLAAISALGLSEQWAMATNRMARGVVMVTAALRAMTVALGAARNAMMGLVSVAFWGLLIKDMLTFLGLWDKVLGVVGKVYAWFGGDRDKLPQWLQSEKELGRITAQTAQQTRTIAKQREEAAKYNATLKTTLTLMAARDSAQTLLTYDSTNPTKAFENVVAGIEAVLVAQSKLKDTQTDISDLERKHSEVLMEQVKLRREAAKAAGGAGEASAVRRLQENEAQLERINVSLGKRRTLEADLMSKLPDAIRNLTQATLTQADAQAVLTRNVTTGISPMEAFAQAQARLLEAQTAFETHQATNQSAYRAPTDSSGQAKAREYEVTLNTLKDAADEATASVAAAQAALFAAAPANLPLQDVVAGLTKSMDANAVRDTAQRMTQAFIDGTKDFKGVAVPNMQIGSLLEAGVVRRTASELRTMYDEMARVATAKANQAKQAVTTAVEETRRATKQAADALADFDRAWTQTQRKQANYSGDQRDASRLRVRLSEIDAEEQKALDSAARIYRHSETLLRSEQAAIAEKYRKIREAEQERLAMKTTQREVKDELSDYDALAAKVKGYKEAIEAANKVLAKPNVGTAEAEQQLRTIEDSAIKAKEGIQQMERIAISLAGREPIGGKMVVSEQDIARLRANIETLGVEVAKAQQASASSMEGIYSRVANSYSELSREQERIMQHAETLINNFRRAHSDNIERVIDDLTRAMATTAHYTEYLDALGAKTNNLKLNPQLLDPLALNAQVNEMVKALTAALAANPTTLKLTADQSAMQASLRSLFDGPSSALPAVELDAHIPDKVMDSMTKDIESKVKPQIEATVRTNFQGGRSGTPAYARGGLVEVLKSFATGGKVSGPGTGTSDSILARLSNGEYVMDALTTRTFGAGFFKTLQQLARSGRGLSLKGMYLPAFASGGPVGNPFDGEGPKAARAALSGLGAGSSEDTPKRDIVEIVMRVGGERVSLFGERQQAGRLVSALKREEGR